jgi:hypothetical protein
LEQHIKGQQTIAGKTGDAFSWSVRRGPGVKRLKEKGRRRNQLPYWNVYILVVTTAWFRRLEWRWLKGYFDQVIVYDAEGDRFTGGRDLRQMGWLRDAVRDTLVPIYYGGRVQHMLRMMNKCKGRFKLWVRRLLQCPMCKLGIPSPWRFCLRDDCSRSFREYVESGVRWRELKCHSRECVSR